jgi:hypothetical protein
LGRGQGKRWGHEMKRIILVVMVAGCLWRVEGARALDADSEAITRTVSGVPTLHPGVVEIGVAGSFKRQEGIQTGTLWARTGMFATVPGGLGGAEVGVGFTHESSLDVFDIEGAISWGRRIGTGGNYPYVLVGGGWRHDNVGSFSQSRYPVGFGLGVRSLVGQKAGFRLEYRFRRVLGDPVADFSEHEITVGVSVFLRNSNRN